MTPSTILRRRLSLCTILVLSGPFLSIQGQNSKEAISWSGWGGPNGNLSVTKSDFFKDNQSLSLEVTWKRNIGSGYSAVSVLGGIAVTGFSDETSNYLAAYATETGKELWRFRMGPVYHGHTASRDGPIATPLITSERVHMLDTYGKLFAVDRSTGVEIWSIDLPSEHDSSVPHYGFSSSPILYRDLVIVLTGGKRGNAVTAFKADDGKIAWSSGNGSVNYQVPILWEHGKKSTLFAATNSHLIGLNPNTGNPYVEYALNGSNNPIGSASTTIVPGSQNQFLFKNSTSSSVLVKLSSSSGEWTVEDQWSTIHLKNTYIPAVYFDGHFFGYNTRTLSCVNEESGELVWRSRKPGDGFLITIDGHLVIITKDGRLSVAPASAKGFKELTGLQVFDDIVWAPPSFAGESLYVRSMSELARVDFVRAAGKSTLDDKVSGVIVDTKFNDFIESFKKSTDKNRDIDAFMKSQTHFPIIEDNMVHFVYRGTADDMAISSPIYGGRFDYPMNRVEGTNFFYFSAELETDARVSYTFTKNFEERVADQNNSSGFVEMPDWVQEIPDPDVIAEHRGIIETVEFDSRLLGKTIPLKVYLPYGYNNLIKYPVAYVNEGDLALQRGQIDKALDHLIGKSVQPLLMVGIPAFKGIPIEKYRQYVGELADLNARMVVEEIVPLIDQRYSTIPTSENRGSIGSAFSAFASFYVTCNYPGVFGKLGVQSITQWEPGFEERNKALMKGAKIQPLSIYLDWGKYGDRSPHEGTDFVKNSRAFAQVLKEKGYAFEGGEYNESDGHPNWRNRYGKLFETLFPLR